MSDVGCSDDLLIDGRGRLYRLLRTEAPSKARGRHPAFTVERLSPRTPEKSCQDLSCLTGRERQVALMLADRATNAEIAVLLGISRFTARHHTESVIAKLGVLCRSDVRNALLRAAGTEALAPRQLVLAGSRKRATPEQRRTLRQDKSA